jgi:NADH dehydrogenase FAD-containing subunit
MAVVVKKRVLILGTGWAGNKLARKLDKKAFDVRLVSPANHFLFTPLLPSTAVGTLEFRAIQEPVRTIPGLNEYYQAKARTLDSVKRVVSCEDLFSGTSFDLSYDYLVIATGSKTNTFGTPGVTENEGKDVFFLKHLHHARGIRNRILECFERASNPTLSSLEVSQFTFLSFQTVLLTVLLIKNNSLPRADSRSQPFFPSIKRILDK